jgi:SPP1 gp7 family putative phage head morphogenesis protein
VGQDEVAQPLVRRANFCRAEQARRRRVAHVPKLSQHGLKAEADVTNDVIKEHPLGSAFADDAGNLGPEVAGVGRIFDEYQTHPQRLRPLRTNMEERLLRAFAGLINQLRQQDLGIERYIWRSQDDAKVRDSHSEYDDQVFRWDEPATGGHPGEAHNCRCYAEPVGVDAPSDVALVDYVPTEGGYPLQDLLEHEAMGGHTVTLHVGKSETFLLRVVRTDQAQGIFESQFRRRHGSFPSLQAAQRLTSSNLSQNALKVNAVATGQRRRAFITSTFSSATGIEAYRTGPTASAPVIVRPTFGVGTVIEYAPDMPNGFIIITSYPRND